jgi:hypothetical protein
MGLPDGGRDRTSHTQVGTAGEVERLLPVCACWEGTVGHTEVGEGLRQSALAIAAPLMRVKCKPASAANPPSPPRAQHTRPGGRAPLMVTELDAAAVSFLHVRVWVRGLVTRKLVTRSWVCGEVGEPIVGGAPRADPLGPRLLRV